MSGVRYRATYWSTPSPPVYDRKQFTREGGSIPDDPSVGEPVVGGDVVGSSVPADPPQTRVRSLRDVESSELWRALEWALADADDDPEDTCPRSNFGRVEHWLCRRTTVARLMDLLSADRIVIEDGAR